MLAAKQQHVPRMWKFAGQMLDLPKMTVKPLLQLRERNMRDVAVVKAFERQVELGAELVECQFSHTRLFEYVIGRAPDRRQIVHQRPRPVENDVSNHNFSLWGIRTGGNRRQRGKFWLTR